MTVSPIPQVSICLPVYNGQEFLRQALDAVLAQSFENYELLISDDCSTDASSEIIKQYASKDPRIIHSRNESRLGLFGNYNKVMEQARGVYIKPFAQDDLWHSELLKKQCSLLDQNANVVLVSGRRIVVDEYGKKMSSQFQPVSLVDILGEETIYSGSQVIKACLDPLINLIGEPCAVMFRAQNRGIGFRTIFKHVGDLEYWLRILAQGDLGMVNEPLVKFRRHNNSTTSKNVSQLWAYIDIVHMADVLKDALAQMNITHEGFVKSSLAIIVRFLPDSIASGDIDMDKIREIENDEFTPSDIVALRKILLYALSMLTEGHRYSPMNTADSKLLNILSNELKVRDAEKLVQGLLKSPSWQLTRPLRELNKVISNPEENSKPDKLIQGTSGGSLIEQQLAYIQYLGRQKRKILKSRSWNFTRPLRRLGKKPNSSAEKKGNSLGKNRQNSIIAIESGQASSDISTLAANAALNSSQSENIRVAKVGNTQFSLYKYELAIGAVVRDEALFLPEWLEYHLLLGVQKFIIFNNASSDNTVEVLKSYIEDGVVEIHDWPLAFTDQSGYLNMQLGAYRRIVDMYSNDVKWLACIDIDEFLVPVKGDNLIEFLADYSDVGGLSVNWTMFGTSKIDEIPEGKLLIEMLQMRASFDDPANHYVKTISRTDRIRRCKDPHSMLYDIGFKQVDTNRAPLFSSMSPHVLTDRLRINHYWTRNEKHFWGTKVPQVDARKDIIAQAELNRRYLDFNKVEDTLIQRFVPAVKARLEARKSRVLNSNSNSKRNPKNELVVKNVQSSLAKYNQAQTLPEQYEYELSIAAIFQNEDRFLREWIEFHRIVGVQKFLLFNNLSNDNYLAVLQPYIANGIVDLFDWPFESKTELEFNQIQCDAYRRAIASCRGRSKWLALIDTDEFLFPVHSESLPEFLQEYENYGALAAPYRVFGTGLVDKIAPGKLMIESLLLRASDFSEHHKNFKSIVRPERVDDYANPHFPKLFSGWPLVSERKFLISEHELESVRAESLRINHYWCRDEEFFRNNKIPRVRKWLVDTAKCEHNKKVLNEAEDDESILRFAAQLRKKMFE